MFRVKDALLGCDIFKEKDPYVYAIVVFSNHKLKIKMDQIPKWCEVIQLKNTKDNSMAELILGKPTTFSADQILAIEQFITTRINNFDDPID